MLNSERRSATVQIGRVEFLVTTLPVAVDEFIREIEANAFRGTIRLSNAYCVALADRDEYYADALAAPGRTLPDGLPVVWTMRAIQDRARGTARAGRVRGPSFFAQSLERAQHGASRHFFAGTDTPTLQSMSDRVAKAYPKLTVVGYCSPAFTTDIDHLAREILSSCENFRPDVIWLGLGAPKQDFVANRIWELSGIPAVGVGAAFDFFAGTSKEAPRLMQISGTEWLFRLLSNPRRLWFRYLWGNSRFLMISFRALLSNRQSS